MPLPVGGPLDRRRFLALAVSGAVAGALGAPSVAHALSGLPPASGGPTTTVWQLATEWTTPRGPHGKTRLVSRASRQAATHRVARSEADALAMNLHPCSWAPAVPVVVSVDPFDEWWDAHAEPWTNPWNGSTVEILDLRHVTATEPATANPVGTGSDAGSGSGSGTGSGAPPAPVTLVAIDGASAAGGATLPRTGADLGAVGLVGVVLAAAGAALAWRSRRMNRSVPDL